MSRSSSSSKPVSDFLTAHSRLTARDRILLGWLADHRALSTPQISSALFSSLRRCQHRLAALRELRFLDTTAPRPGYQSTSLLHLLGPHGYRWAAARAGLDPPSDRMRANRNAAIAASQRLGHMLGANGFFIALAAHARQHPDTALHRWLNEEQASHLALGVRPDGYGQWATSRADVGFFLEYDTGTEQLHRLTTKIDRYATATATGAAAWPVVFWLHSRKREANLHQAIIDSRRDAYPIATGVHADDPAKASLLIVGSSRRRIPLTDLPQPG